MFFYNPTYLLFMIPAFILMGITSWYVKSSYNKWSQIRAGSGLTGSQAAQRLISNGNLYGVQVQGTQGELSDHYDPRNKTLYLSNSVANSPSVASVAVAAHELGHAMQDAEEYFPLRFRAALVPVVSIGSNLGWILIMVGLIFLRSTALGLNIAWLGVLFFAGGALFALATLPVEFDASARAKHLLRQTGIIQSDEEMRGVNQVLNAAALTYVAGLITAVLQLLYYVLLVGGGGRRRG
jgi:Zn-dependent membrane protease YugP